MNNTADSRRDFIKKAGLVSASVTILPSYTMNGPVPQPKLSPAMGKALSVDGKWIPVVCWHDCGGRCALKAWVVNKRVLRLKSDDTHQDSPDYPQQRACVRGRSQRMQVFAPDRLKYPMRRKQWSPGGGDRSLRGKDEWVRISWDEALDIVTQELKRVKEQHGNESIYCRGGEINRTINLFGGCVDSWMTDSLGSWMGVRVNSIGLYAKRKPGNGFRLASASIGDRMDLRNSRACCHVGCEPRMEQSG